MPSNTPVGDTVTGKLDTDQTLSVATPLGNLIGLFIAVSLVPFALAFSQIYSRS